MENFKKPLIIILGVIFVWHLQVALFSKNKVSGFLMAKPGKPGFVWADAKNTDSRFFWQNNDIVWKEGAAHPDFKVMAGKLENLWNPAPGYVFVDETKGLETKWKPGIKHPHYMAFADDAEGKFIPATGYKFIYNADNETFADCIWEPNKRYDDKKLISGTEKDTFECFPGYSFIDPEKNLDVAWSPGMINSDNPKLIAGQKEGSWEVNVRPVVKYRNYRNNSDEAGREFARRVFWHVF